MDPNRRQPPPYAYGQDYNPNFANDPNVWPGQYASTTTSVAVPPTSAASGPHSAWSANLPFVPQPYLESQASQASQHHQHHQHHQHQHQHQHQHHHPQLQYQQQPFSTPSPAAFHTPLSDSYLLTQAAPSPYAYHASPSAYPLASPVPRSMSVSALSNIDPASSPQQQSPQQQQQPPPAQQGSNTFLPTPRQIRFVSSDGQPHTKRRRINAACLTCRKRKTRCSGERPECRTCTDNGHTCAGYADRASRKESDKPSEEGDEDDEEMSGPSSPKKPIPESSQPSSRSNVAHHTSVRKDGGSKSRQAAQEPGVEVKSPQSNYTTGSVGTAAGRTRVPYFRYFGPTAIVPGFKQMVVQMKNSREHRRSHASVSADSPVAGPQGDSASVNGREMSPVPVDLPYYDATNSAPNPTLITHLCEMFFANLGCNYPFLQRERFMKDLEEKRVDAILVNAVCAVAARFSSEPLLRKSDLSLPLDQTGEVKRAFRGQPFAQRAMSAVIETFSCPTLAVTQACLLLAYEEFGSDRDSGLWMYLGTSIRMAQDLGIQKLEGLQLEGRLGPTPKTAKHSHEGKQEEARRAEQQRKLSETILGKDDGLLDDRRASEQERIDTFWAIFFLDRAVSSGVGRPVTLRDKDIEISFPYRPDERIVDGYPHPFPAMIRIVHMYGRVADVLNNIKDHTEVTDDVLRRLASIEKDLTGIYQRMSPRLHFNAINFQHYVKAEQGTNFILLHFWFHTLIVLLHQPTLMHSFEGSIQQLFPDSRELSMSSAKTIADILAFAELIDVKSFIGNPFTSQPMYVAACAFLAEAAAHASQPPSRDHSPFERAIGRDGRTEKAQAAREAEQKLAAKHTLLATAANQNYQRCYKALKLLDSYWAGCRYILTALDQKSKGLMDPLLFTSDDVDEMPSTEPSFTTPGWRRTSWGASLGGPAFDKMRVMRSSSQEIPWTPKMDWSHAIGWSLTGTVNSPAPNLSFLYQQPTNENEQSNSSNLRPPRQQQQQQQRQQRQQMSSSPRLARADVPTVAQTHMNDYSGVQSQDYSAQSSMLPPSRVRMSTLPYDPVATADGELLLGLHSPYSVGSNNVSTTTPNPQPQVNTPTFEYTRQQPAAPPPPSSMQQQQPQQQPQQTQRQQPQQSQHLTNSYFPVPNTSNYSNLMIESQEIDMTNQNHLSFNGFSFPGGDMLSWLEYLPQDVLNYFGDSTTMDMDLHGNTPAAGMVLPSGPGPPGGPGPPDTGQSRHDTPG